MTEDRSDEAGRAKPHTSEADASQRVAVVAKLLPGSRERATQILAKGAPYGLGLARVLRDL